MDAARCKIEIATKGDVMADWTKLTSRGEVDDRRGLGGVGALGGGIGVIGVLIVLVLQYFGISVDPAAVSQVLEQVNQATVSQQSSEQPAEFKGQDDYEVFASTVVGSTSVMWHQVFRDSGAQYVPPTIVLFRGATRSGCGVASSEVGPHYCPPDQTIYLDETFFDELRERFGGNSGDVAQAYVIAHEVGHHVQQQMGQLGAARTRNAEASIATELQADCYAGLWAHSAAKLNVFEPGEIREAMDAAAAVGDDRIQVATGIPVTPETWTHGSSEQRVAAFTVGYDTGRVGQCVF